MAKPYKEGKGWAYRLRVAGEDIYRAGFKSEALARAHMEKVKVELTEGPAQSGFGPQRTSLGVAFLDYACERLPYLKGAEQDARRINRYLRALRLPVVELTPVELVKDGKRVYWTVTLREEAESSIPESLRAHRIRQSEESSESDRLRRRLATMMMADVTTHHIQELLNALRAEGKKSATVHLERSELRRLFKHASARWKWKRSGGNPAGSELDMPPIDAGRDRVLSNEEWQRMWLELANYGNPHVAPLACLMLETAMRSCEPLVHLRWGHVNWSQRVLELPDAKTGARKVPLSPGAIHILLQLKDQLASPPSGEDKVFPTTYEAVKKAWSVARERAGVKDVGLHDLRHTSATRFALEFKGNVPVLMVITGHKTGQMVMRYVNVKASEVATLMHGEELDVQQSAAGYKMSVTAALDAAVASTVRAPHAEPIRVGEERLQGARTLFEPNDKAMAPAKRVGTVVGEKTPMRSAPTVAGQNNVIAVNFGRRAAA